MPNIHIIEFSALLDESKIDSATKLHPFREHAIDAMKAVAEDAETEANDVLILVSSKYSENEMQVYLRAAATQTDEFKCDRREKSSAEDKASLAFFPAQTINVIQTQCFPKETKDAKDQKSTPTNQRKIFIEEKLSQVSRSEVITYFDTDVQVTKSLQTNLAKNSKVNIFHCEKPEEYLYALVRSFCTGYPTDNIKGSFNLVRLQNEFSAKLGHGGSKDLLQTAGIVRPSVVARPAPSASARTETKNVASGTGGTSSSSISQALFSLGGGGPAHRSDSNVSAGSGSSDGTVRERSSVAVIVDTAAASAAKVSPSSQRSGGSPKSPERMIVEEPASPEPSSPNKSEKRGNAEPLLDKGNENASSKTGCCPSFCCVM